MSNVISFPKPSGDTNYTAQELAQHLLYVVMKQYQSEAESRFWLANELMHLSDHIVNRKAFSFDEVIDHVIDNCPEVYAIADNYAPKD